MSSRSLSLGRLSILVLESSRELFCQLLRFDILSLPYHDDFIRRRRLRRQAPQATLQTPGTPIGGDDDARG